MRKINNIKINQLISYSMNFEKIRVTNVIEYIPLYNNLSENTKKPSNVITEIGDRIECDELHTIHKCIVLAQEKNVFFKLAPLICPIKYMTGEFTNDDDSADTGAISTMVNNPNNTSYVDGFFSYLTSVLLHQHNVPNGVDVFGIYSCIKKDFKINIYDDIERLHSATFFNQYKGSLFSVQECKLTDTQRLPKLVINDNSENIIIPIDSFDKDENATISSSSSLTQSSLSEIDITCDACDDDENSDSTSGCESDSVCSSRTSYTREDYEDIMTDSDDDTASDNSSSSSNTLTEPQIIATVQNIPVCMIGMEMCEHTLDHLILHEMLSETQLVGALMQIIMTLIILQDKFLFTHNDLHASNVMSVSTSLTYITYIHNGIIYNVPTHGRVYKIIDFGRSIYTFNNELFCSGDFDKYEYAYGQYNTEPFFDANKRRVDPNYSFDLCRLGCALTDIFDDSTKYTKDTAIYSIIKDWCTDDNGLNILYKRDGTDRYDGFKLYIMIAKSVHMHTPENQLKRPLFSQFIGKEPLSTPIDISNIPPYYKKMND